MRDTALVVFARAPEHGRVKARLALEIGEHATLAVYRQMLEIMAHTTRAWPGPVLLASTGDPRHYAGTGLEQHLGCEQRGANLGARLAAALRAGLQLAHRAIVVGTDCPTLRPRHLAALVDALATADCALGPATDGGFWACATSSPRVADLLDEPSVPWCSGATLAAVRRQIELRGLTSRLGPTLPDVDTLADLRCAIAAKAMKPPDAPGIHPDHAW